MIKIKFFIFLISIFLIILGGTANMYPLYLHKVMEKFEFSVKQINIYGSIITFGTWTGFPATLIYDTYGPKTASLIGIITLSVSFIILHCFLNYNIFKGMSFFPFEVLALLFGQSNFLLYSSALLTNIQNFKFKQNSTICGILLASLAISPSLFTTYREYFSNDYIYDNFYLVLAFFILIIGLMCSYIIETTDHPYEDDKLVRKFQKYKEKNIMLIILVYNILLILVFIIGVFINHSKSRYAVPLIAIYPIAQLLSFIIIVLENRGIFDDLLYPRFKKITDNMIKSQIEMENLPPTANVRDIKKVNSSISQFDISLPFIDSIKNKKFIILFIIFLLGVGTSISNLNNINFILKSLSYKIHYNGINKGLISIYKVKELFYYVILYFSFNALITIFGGIFLGLLIKIKKAYIFIAIISIIGVISQLIAVFTYKTGLMVSISLSGAVQGGYLMFAPVYIQNIFGNKNLGKIFGVLLISIGIGAIIINETVFKTKYDYQGISEECLGKECYRGSFIITTIFFCINSGLCYFLK